MSAKDLLGLMGTMAGFNANGYYDGPNIKAKEPKEKDPEATCLLKVGKVYLGEVVNKERTYTKDKKLAVRMCYAQAKELQEVYGGKVVRI